MIRYPCPAPETCGVQWHRDPSKCVGTLKSTNGRLLPQFPPSSAASPSTDPERVGFKARGGEIVEEWFPNGQKMYEQWYLDDNYHREGGPAYQEWSESGDKTQEGWYIRGVMHREDGPAGIGRYEDVEDGWVEYYLDGDDYTPEEFARYRAARDTGMPHEWAMEMMRKTSA